MALGKAVFAETLDLVEAALGEFAVVALGRHAFDHFVLEILDRADAAEGRHGAAQPVGLGGREAAATMAIFIACSWNSGTPSVFSSTVSSSRDG